MSLVVECPKATLTAMSDGRVYRVQLGYVPDYDRKIISVLDTAKAIKPDGTTYDLPAGDYESIPDKVRS